MKCLIVNGSARLPGNSSAVCDYLADLLAAHEVERIDLASRRIQMCKGCRLCFDRGERYCPCKDDVLDLYERMRSADLLVIAGPIYVEDVNGLTKNWIDRLAFNSHRPGLFRQKAYIVLNSGSGASSHALRTLQRALQTWGVQLVGHRKLVLGARTGKPAFLERYGRLLQKDMALVIRKSLRKTTPSFLQLLTFDVQKWFYRNRMDKDSADYQHWKNNGWLEDGCNFYDAARIGFPKKIAARLLGRIVIFLVLR